jgi:protein ImuB
VRSSREQWACVDVPALPLQLLARRHPEWIELPMAVVAEDRPQGLILWVNERAYRARVLSGMRYAAGLSLCRELCAGVVTSDEIDGGVGQLAERLRGFSPHVEPSPHEPGVFWLDAGGLLGIEPSLGDWAVRIREQLLDAGFIANVAVGFSRFGAYAVARTTRGTVVFDDLAAERASSHRVRLDRLHLAPRLRDRLAHLGVRTVGELLSLPADGLGKRFGSDALALHRQASGNLQEPLQASIPEPDIDAWIELDYPEINAQRLAFIVRRVLDRLLPRLAARAEGLVRIQIDLLLDDRERVTDEIRTAEPTLEAPQILELIALRLEMLELSAGVVEMHLTAQGRAIDTEQLSLFAEAQHRDLSAANRALARIRTEFGHPSVVTGRLRPAHLPEASFSWEPLDEIRLPSPRQVALRPLVRRIFNRPVALPHRGHHEPDGWLVRGPEQGPMVRLLGPYTVSGGWWVREVHRDYHYAETQNGDILWVFYDRRRRRWFLHGQVE